MAKQPLVPPVDTIGDILEEQKWRRIYKGLRGGDGDMPMLTTVSGYNPVTKQMEGVPTKKQPPPQQPPQRPTIMQGGQIAQATPQRDPSRVRVGSVAQGAKTDEQGNVIPQGGGLGELFGREGGLQRDSEKSGAGPGLGSLMQVQPPGKPGVDPRTGKIDPNFIAQKYPTPQAKEYPLARKAEQDVVDWERDYPSEHKPGMGRRIAAYALGALGGIGAPERGLALGSYIYHQPFQKKVTDWEGELKRRKDIAGVYETQEKQEEAENLDAYKNQLAAAKSDAEAQGNMLKAAQAQSAIDKAEHYQTLDRVSLWKIDPQRIQERIDELKLKDKLKDKQLFGTQLPTGEWTTMYEDRDSAGNLIYRDIYSGKALGPEDRSKAFQIKGEPAPKESFAAKNAEWDRRNKVLFGERMQALQTGLQNAIARLRLSDTLIRDRPTARTKDRMAISQDIQKMEPGIIDMIDNLADEVGPYAGRWNDLYVNKGGFNDPNWVGLDQSLHMYALAVMNAHLGRSGSTVILQDIEKRLGEAQTPEDLKARVETTEGWIDQYAKNKNIPIVGEEPNPLRTPTRGVTPRGPGQVKPPATVGGGFSLDEINAEVKRIAEEEARRAAAAGGKK